jgi:hypothetical protein
MTPTKQFVESYSRFIPNNQYDNFTADLDSLIGMPGRKDMASRIQNILGLIQKQENYYAAEAIGTLLYSVGVKIARTEPDSSLDDHDAETSALAYERCNQMWIDRIKALIKEVNDAGYSGSNAKVELLKSLLPK